MKTYFFQLIINNRNSKQSILQGKNESQWSLRELEAFVVIIEPPTWRARDWHRIPEFGMGLLKMKVKRRGKKKKMEGRGRKKVPLLVLRIPEMVKTAFLGCRSRN